MTARRIKFIVIIGLLAVGVALHLSCGEDSLPPSSPPHTGTVTATGYAD